MYKSTADAVTSLQSVVTGDARYPDITAQLVVTYVLGEVEDGPALIAAGKLIMAIGLYRRDVGPDTSAITLYAGELAHRLANLA